MTVILINNIKNANKNTKYSHYFNSNRSNPLYIGSLILTSLVLIISSTWLVSQIILRNSEVAVFEFNLSPLQRTSSKFLSFAIDASLLRHTNDLPILNKAFVNLARHLSPAYVRFGGTSADCLFFNETSLNSSARKSAVNGEDISHFTIFEKDFLSLYEFSKRSSLRMLFDLNALIRNTDGTWNNSNARKIITFAKNNEMNLDWQLGNEPPSFPFVFNLTVTPEQLAKDYNHLRSLLDTSGFKDSILVGPEVNQVGGSARRGELYAEEFLQHIDKSVNYVTWHQYYMRGEDARVEDFVNVSTFNYLAPAIKSMDAAISSSGKRIPMWLSETSTAYDGGTPNVSDRFVAGFLWLDKLGYCAKAGISVVIRQTFFGGNYAMISSDLQPNPDWWVSVIFKRLVSNRVLSISSPKNLEHLRFYAHCTPEEALLQNTAPAITIFGVNIDKNPIQISILGIPLVSKSTALLYALTSNNLQSRSIQLNGEVLKLTSNGDLPQMKPIKLQSVENITLPGYSMIFIVIYGANVTECLK